jgi:phosphoribosylaminoimidazole-succinocarboxamide synthase
MSRNPEALFESRLQSLPLAQRGKVRDIYAVDERHLLVVTTDRLSAFDVVLPDPIPGKGCVLNGISRFWFERTRHIIPNQLDTLELHDVLADPAEREQVAGRAMVVRRLEPLPIEAVVRGYLIGSGWKDYQCTGSVCGISLPPNLRLADQLPEPIFTPATKAERGHHDENIAFAQVERHLGAEVAAEVRETSLALYRFAAEHAAQRGIMIADTKFEFALDNHGGLILIDEALTPDSSRFWPGAEYRPGESPPSFDKQFVRDYLETLDWDKSPPGPKLPQDIIEKTAAKYREAFARLTS